MDLIVCIQFIQLIQRLHSDAVFLCDRVHRLALPHIMSVTLIILGRLLLFLLQPEDLARLQVVTFVTLIILRQLLVADAHLLSQTLKGVALTHDDIVVLVERLDHMQILTVHRLILRVLIHELIIVLRLVILVELIQLDDLYQLIGILRIRGIAGSLQSLRPTLVVGLLQ